MYLRDYINDSFTEKEFEERYNLIRSGLVAGMTPDNDRCTIILGGQPGAGKSTFYEMKDDLLDFIPINGDDFRKYHPRYDAIVKTDPEHYAERTQAFSNRIVETLISDLGSHGYNLIIEGTLRNPDVPIRTCEDLRNKGYHADLVVVACDAETAWRSTISRAIAQKESGQMPRLVPIDIYDYTVHIIPDSMAKIEERDCFDSIMVVDRNRNILFDKRMHDCSAADIIRRTLNLPNWEKKLPDLEQEFVRVKIDILKSKLAKGRNDDFFH